MNIPTESVILVSSTKILNCVSDSIRSIIPLIFGSTVRRFSQYIHPLTTSIGDFNPGVQPRGTPISAEVIRGGDVEINVMWRDADGRPASSSWSESSGWDHPKPPNEASHLLDGPAKSVTTHFLIYNRPNTK